VILSKMSLRLLQRLTCILRNSAGEQVNQDEVTNEPKKSNAVCNQIFINFGEKKNESNR